MSLAPHSPADVLKAAGFSETGGFLLSASSVAEAEDAKKKSSVNLITWPAHHVAAALDLSLDDAKRMQRYCAAKYLMERRIITSSALLSSFSSLHGSSASAAVAATSPSPLSSSTLQELGSAHHLAAGAPPTSLPGPSTVLAMLNSSGSSIVPTGLPPLDGLMLGGLPRAMVTELVGAAGSGKTLVAHHIAAHVASCGQRVVVIDSDSRWSAMLLRDLLAPQQHDASSPNEASKFVIAALRRVDVVRSIRSLDDLKRHLAELQSVLISRAGLALLVVDSFASLVRGSYSGHPEEVTQRTEAILSSMQDLKTIAETLHIAVLITSHASSSDFHQNNNSNNISDIYSAPGGSASAAFGTSFYHAINTRLVLEESLLDGRRMRLLRVAKSPMCRPAAFELLLKGDGGAGGRSVGGGGGAHMMTGDGDDESSSILRLRELPAELTRTACAQLAIAARAHFSVMTNNYAHAAAPRFL